MESTSGEKTAKEDQTQKQQFIHRGAVFYRMSYNQNQSNHSNQSQTTKTIQRTNQI